MLQGEKNDRQEAPEALRLISLIASGEGSFNPLISQIAVSAHLVSAAKLDEELAIPAEWGKLLQDFTEKKPS
jgi:hypothetical protein